MELQTDGDLKLGSVNLIVDTAGKGVLFHGHADGNNLDDYEEGTWTPDPKFGGNNTGMSKTVNGYYVKIGKNVTAYYQIIFTNKGSSTGNFAVNGFPFTNSLTELTLPSFGYFHRFIFGNDTTYMITCNLSGTSSSWRYAVEGTAGTGQNMAAVTDANVSSAIHVAGAIHYRAS